MYCPQSSLLNVFTYTISYHFHTDTLSETLNFSTLWFASLRSKAAKAPAILTCLFLSSSSDSFGL